MKIKSALLVLSLLYVISFKAQSQNDSLIDSPIEKNPKPTEKQLKENGNVSKVHSQPEEIFSIVEEMPEFPGGENALIKYLSNNIKYPSLAKEQNIQGKVFVKFVVTKTGKIDDVKVARSVNTLLDEEAIRVVKGMPDWKPGKQNGRPVNVNFILPIFIELR